MIWPILFVALLAVHLILMHLASAGPLVAASVEWLGCRAAKHRDSASSERSADPLRVTETVGRRLTTASIASLLASSIIGLVLFWFAGKYGNRDYGPVIDRFYDRVWWGAAELLTYVVAMAIYLYGWNRLRDKSWKRAVHRCIAIFAATNLLYHFPPLLTIMTDAMHQPDLPAEPITSAGFRSLLFQQPILAKTLHFTFASFAVAGAWLIQSVNPTTTNGEASRVIRMGAIFVVGALVVQLLLGLWLVVLAGPVEQAQLMGKDAIAAGLLMAGVLLSLVAMNQAAAIAMDDLAEDQPPDQRVKSIARRAKLVSILVVVVVVAMAAVTARLGGLG